ncbi:Dnajb5 [Symbiodinium necroappetens]|uniref:Dnajb5 protein n=1 Tax=Symbiodinium necroappetens TaxID=1628268 RepID=A0A812J5J1_9DINO|nr:Dnajb5 [Symbiodinium necroappetens]
MWATRAWGLLGAIPWPIWAIETGEIFSELQSYVRDPIARHTACAVDADTPTVCVLEGFVGGTTDLDYYILTLPEEGLLYETSPNFRSFGSEPLQAPDPIGPHLLPFLVTDPKHQVVYVPPPNKWPTPNAWTTFTFVVRSLIGLSQDGETIIDVQSEPGLVVLVNPHRQIAGSDFNLAADGADGWTVSGQLEVVGGNTPSAGVRHQAVSWGGLNQYIYGADEVQSLDFATGIDLAKWYFEASPKVYHKKEMAVAYGGTLRFRVRAQYGDFLELNAPLDWVTIECESCDTGHGARIIRFVDDTLRWIGNEVYMEFLLNENGRWSYDPLNSAADFQYATACQIAAILTLDQSMSKDKCFENCNPWRFHSRHPVVEMLDCGEGIALDDVAVVAADASELLGVEPSSCASRTGCHPGKVFRSEMARMLEQVASWPSGGLACPSCAGKKG